MTIRTKVSEEWLEVLSVLTEDEQKMLIEEAEHLANAMKYRNQFVRISTNGALEILFVVACEMNRRDE